MYDKNNNPILKDQAMIDYFNSLPVYVQENIMMAAVTFDTMDDLRRWAEKIMEPDE